MHLPPPPPQERQVEFQQIFNQLGEFLHLPPAPPPLIERKVELQKIFNQLRGFLHLPPPPPPQDTVEEQSEQVELIETLVEVDQVGFEEQVVVDNIEQVPDDDDIEIVAEFPAPERRHRNARRVTDDDEYVVESGVATTTMKIAGNTVMKKE